MERFKEFYKLFTQQNVEVVEESLDARIDDLTSGGIFSHFGRDAIERRFQWYKDSGIVPLKKVSKKATGNVAGSDVKTIDVEEKDFEEMLPYVFKFVDKEVRDTLEKAYKDDTKKLSKLNKHYKDVAVRPVEEDASQINSVLTHWLLFRHNTKSVQKSLRQKISFNTLQDQVDEAYNKMTSSTVSGDVKSEVDSDMPEGFSFVKASGEFRLYKWTDLAEVCELDPRIKQNWLSLIIDITGKADHKWCIGVEEWAREYGDPDGSGKFKYPYYLLRKKDGDSFKPYVLMHGKSLQCKDKGDVPIDEAIAEEIYPHIKSHLETIIFGDK